ncbi:MAG: hypothetical protein AB7F09_11920 [Parvibaculaceae bacterium]
MSVLGMLALISALGVFRTLAIADYSFSVFRRKSTGGRPVIYKHQSQ